MKVFRCSRKDITGKFEKLIKVSQQIWADSVLDIGCRNRKLKELLPQEISYFGLDISTPADIVGSLDNGLPFRNNSFNVIVAFDILEHTNDIHFSFCELCRVTKRYIYITLPNMYDVKFRINILFGKKISEKYGLSPEISKDRHRWFFSLKNAQYFIQTMAHQKNMNIIKEGCLVGPYRGIWPMKQVISWFPNLLCATYVVLLAKR